MATLGGQSMIVKSKLVSAHLRSCLRRLASTRRNSSFELCPRRAFAMLVEKSSMRMEQGRTASLARPPPMLEALRVTKLSNWAGMNSGSSMAASRSCRLRFVRSHLSWRSSPKSNSPDMHW